MANFLSGVVKAVTSGDTLVIVGAPKGGPPPEKTIKLTGCNAPMLGWKDRPDQPFAWACREALRQKVVGKNVTFKIEGAAVGRRSFGEVWINKKSLSEWLLSEGWGTANVRGDATGTEAQKLQEAAQAAEKGMWTKDKAAVAAAVRTVQWSGTFDAKELYEELKGQRVDAVIDQVRDGSTLRVILLPTHHNITLFLAGVRCPGFKRGVDGGDDVAAPFAAEAKFFTEIRLLHRDVQVSLDSCDDKGNFFGTVHFPTGNISEFLCKEGLASVVEWSAAFTDYADKLRKGESFAKKKHIRMWKDWTPTAATVDDANREWDGRVAEIHSGDCVTVRDAEGVEHKLYLSSVRTPRVKRDNKSEPYAHEAKEFLRKKSIGKKVHVHLDYIKPGTDGYDSKTFATVVVDKKSLNVALVSSGFATVTRHRADEERSHEFDELMTAQTKATNEGRGQHSTKKNASYAKHNDMVRDKEVAETLLSSLRRKSLTGIVDYVINGARFKVYIPKEDTVVPFVLEAIRCPRYDSRGESEEFGEEAYKFAKKAAFQREVEIEIEMVDKGGSFVGNIVLDGGRNLSTMLLTEGLAYTSERSLERSDNRDEFTEAEARAKAAKLKYWSTYVEPTAVEENEESGPQDLNKEFYDVVVTEVVDPTHVWVQVVGDGTAALEKLMGEFKTFHAESEETLAAEDVQVDDYYSACFSVDDEWYRAKVLEVEESGDIRVLFVDFGNSETLSVDRLRPIAPAFTQLAPQARLCTLAFLIPPEEEDEDMLAEAKDTTEEYALGRQLVANVEYRTGDKQWVISLFDPSERTSLNAALLRAGVVRIENRREGRFKKMINKLRQDEQAAKDARLGLWYYGDIDYDEPKEVNGPDPNDRPKSKK